MLWILGGSLSFIIGLIGVVLPILPTTPLIILAGFCFGKSSPRLHHWLITNKYFGRYIQDYQKGHGVPIRIKWLAVSFVWTGIVVSLLVIPLFLVKIFMITVGIGVSTFIFTSPLLKEKHSVLKQAYEKVAK